MMVTNALFIIMPNKGQMTVYSQLSTLRFTILISPSLLPLSHLTLSSSGTYLRFHLRQLSMSMRFKLFLFSTHAAKAH